MTTYYRHDSSISFMVLAKVGEIYKIDMADLQSHLQIFPLRIPT